MAKTLPRIDDEAVKYTGVLLHKWGKYVSEIRLPNSRERIWLGSYDTAEKASLAFDAAQFNFPDDPPSIAGGQALTPAEIQAVAQNYANRFGAGVSGSNQPPPPPPPKEVEPESLMLNSDRMDWSFLEALDSEQSRGHSGRVSDFKQLFYEPGDAMYMALSFGDRANDDDDDDEGGNVYSLWNF